jgi:pyridinium-3,5-bisthiocarboxylic acid mononucleotide nickel chelatase
MKIAYFDCFSGASGDMILGALVDAGLSERKLKGVVKALNLPTVRLKIQKVSKGGIGGTRVIVEGRGEKKTHRHLKEMLEILERSGLDDTVKEKSREIFRRIATAEGEIHGKPMEEVHFHEIGGLDSIVDIACGVWGLRELGVDEIQVSKINVGGGFVRCEHGLLPVPAPATLALMKGFPLYSSGVERELLTPTGAAILTTVASRFGAMPAMKVERIGYGAGSADLPHPNLLRLVVGTLSVPAGQERVTVVETNIDDMNPQIYDHLIERLLAMGVQEVFLTPILMKKSRPATQVTVICPPEKLPPVTEFLLRETTTLGLRWREEERACADREILPFETQFGKIRFKLARWDGRLINLSPEYEDCRKAALAMGQPLKTVLESTKREALGQLESAGSGKGRALSARRSDS